MKITCKKCGAVYHIDEARLRPGGSRTRCLKCRTIFTIRPPESAPDPRQAGQKPSRTCLQKPPVFRIIGANNCPLYTRGDEFQLAGSIFNVPRNKAPCLILARDLVRILSKYKPDELPLASDASGKVFQCSGCKGVIRFARRQNGETEEEASDRPDDDYIENVTRVLSRFSIFKALDENVIREFTACLRFDEFGAEDLILTRGEPGKHLFIIVSGRVEVIGEDDMQITTMDRGEVFGEMSLLSGDTVGATVRALEPTTVLYISSQNFKTILSNSPSLQMYFTRLLAGRMAEINRARSEEFASGIAGKISEMSPAELFQVFNMNQKTGVLSLRMYDISARLAFRDGDLVRVNFGDADGPEAFFSLLKLKRGRFTFKPGLCLEDMQADVIGDFMQLLMEGLRRIDEDDKRFLRTAIRSLFD
ncbi:Crp/Fnr family transcriptional regulator [Desulfonema ishimotonii]|uniref:Crp/Fnr family transcriptional regulator n=1 Tax=Desulfonema ishimotonii TaxID=45657 RepID=A0A401G257_9BACT|nr:DUF4388 domain-containing protein [Desulfonema ishimotonii]GBC63318.1 Crp/Fnr family transcriptional regulator [Desulfonema ishimotonii]